MTAPRILIVEDEIIIAATLKNDLIKLGYDVLGFAARGHEAQRISHEQMPDLVLMDIKLRGMMDGIEAGKAIYDQLSIPVVYVTAHIDDLTVKRAMESHLFGYLVKPVKTSDLRMAIEVALKKSQQERAGREREAWLNSVIQSLGEAFLATDRSGAVMLVNTAVESLTGWTPVAAIGHHISEVLVLREKTAPNLQNMDFADLFALDQALAIPNGTVCLARDGKQTFVEGIVSPIRNDLGEVYGMAVLLHVSFAGLDSGQPSPLESAEVLKTEDGQEIVSICASCKKMKDSQQNWIQLEQYFLKRFGLWFSHGMCPGCYESYMAEFYQRRKKD